MSGVIGSDGVQWERCNGCGGWEEFDQLGYEQPSTRFPYGRDLCRGCVGETPEVIEARRIAQSAIDDQERAEYNATPQRMVCGHMQVPPKQVYTFVETGPNTTQVFIFCSQECKDAAAKEEEEEEIAAAAVLATCGGCGGYGQLGRTHVRNGEECGTYV